MRQNSAIFLNKDYWGRGLMTECVKNIIIYLSFTQFGFKKLRIVTHHWKIKLVQRVKRRTAKNGEDKGFNA